MQANIRNETNDGASLVFDFSKYARNETNDGASLVFDFSKYAPKYKPWLTIRQTAAAGILSEHYLRLRLKQNKLPGFYSGSRFIVDVYALIDLLHREALATCGGVTE